MQRNQHTHLPFQCCNRNIMIFVLIEILSGPSDFFDRFHWQLSSFALFALAIALTAVQFLSGSAIQCWAPAQFKGGWEQIDDHEIMMMMMMMLLMMVMMMIIMIMIMIMTSTTARPKKKFSIQSSTVMELTRSQLFETRRIVSTSPQLGLSSRSSFFCPPSHCRYLVYCGAAWKQFLVRLRMVLRRRWDGMHNRYNASNFQAHHVDFKLQCFLNWTTSNGNNLNKFEGTKTKFIAFIVDILPVFVLKCQTNRTCKTPMASDRVVRRIQHAAAEDVDLHMRVQWENRFKTLDSAPIELKFGMVRPCYSRYQLCT